MPVGFVVLLELGAGGEDFTGCGCRGELRGGGKGLGAGCGGGGGGWDLAEERLLHGLTVILFCWAASIQM